VRSRPLKPGGVPSDDGPGGVVDADSLADGGGGAAEAVLPLGVGGYGGGRGVVGGGEAEDVEIVARDEFDGALSAVSAARMPWKWGTFWMC